MTTEQKLNWQQTGEDNDFTKSVKDYIDSCPVIDGCRDTSGFDEFMNKLEAIKIKGPVNNQITKNDN